MNSQGDCTGLIWEILWIIKTWSKLVTRLHHSTKFKKSEAICWWKSPFVIFDRDDKSSGAIESEIKLSQIVRHTPESAVASSRGMLRESHVSPSREARKICFPGKIPIFNALLAKVRLEGARVTEWGYRHGVEVRLLVVDSSSKEHELRNLFTVWRIYV